MKQTAKHRLHITSSVLRLLLLSLLFVKPAWGAFVVIASTCARSTTGTNVTTSAINTSGANLLILHATRYGPGGSQTISDSNSNTWTPLTERGAASARARLHYVFSPSVGSGHTFTVSSSGADTFPNTCVLAVSGADSFEEENGAGINAATIQPGSVTPDNNGSLVVTDMSVNNATHGTISIGSGFTKIGQNNHTAGQSLGGAMAYLIQGTAAAVNPTWSWTGAAESSSAIAVFAPSAAAAARRRVAPIIFQ